MSSSQPVPKTVIIGPGLVRQNGIVLPHKGPGLHHSSVVREVKAPKPSTKGGKRSRRRRGTTKRTPKPKWASTRRYRARGGSCSACTMPRGGGSDGI